MTTDAIEIVHRRFFAGKPRMEALLREERANAEIAQMIYDLRTKANLTHVPQFQGSGCWEH